MLQDRFDVGGKTRNITIQFVLQQSCNTGCVLVFFARFSVPQRKEVKRHFSLPQTHNEFSFYQKSWRSSPSSRLDNGPLVLIRAVVLADLLLVLFFGRKDGLWKGNIVNNRVSYISTKRRVKSLNDITFLLVTIIVSNRLSTK